MTYTRPSGVEEFTGARAFGRELCTWTGASAYLWRPDEEWLQLSSAPTALDSGFKLQSGLLAGADTHVGFLPSGASDWAWWHDLSSFTDAHPMYGNLLLCSDGETGTYTLFSVAANGLDVRARFAADDLAQPLAGWSPPTNPERLLLLGTDGLWALDPPYTPSSLQPLVSFEDVALPARTDIPAPFQSGVATVVIPRRSRTALRLDLSNGSGHATGLKHVSGDAALWTAYLQNDRTVATRILSTLATLPPPDRSPLQLHDVLVDDGSIRAVATSAGLFCPEARGDSASEETANDLLASPLGGAALTTWALWLEWDGAVATACRALCHSPAPDIALAESLQIFAGDTAVKTLFELLHSDSPPTSASGGYEYPIASLRTLVAPLGPEIASLVTSHLSESPVPARRAACAMAGATSADAPSSSSTDPSATPALWNDVSSMPTEALRANTHHEHPAVRAAARDTCRRFGIDFTDDAAATEDAAPAQSRHSVQSSQPESPK